MRIYTPTIKKIHDNTDEQMTLVGGIVRPLSGGEDMGPSPGKLLPSPSPVADSLVPRPSRAPARKEGLLVVLSQHAYGNFVMQRDSHMTAV